ncbi:MAG: hypothetical protein ABR598_07705 [Candidatus Dormibacteria bacterium]
MTTEPSVLRGKTTPLELEDGTVLQLRFNMLSNDALEERFGSIGVVSQLLRNADVQGKTYQQQLFCAAAACLHPGSGLPEYDETLFEGEKIRVAPDFVAIKAGVLQPVDAAERVRRYILCRAGFDPYPILKAIDRALDLVLPLPACLDCTHPYGEHDLRDGHCEHEGCECAAHGFACPRCKHSLANSHDEKGRCADCSCDLTKAADVGKEPAGTEATGDSIGTSSTTAPLSAGVAANGTSG